MSPRAFKQWFPCVLVVVSGWLVLRDGAHAQYQEAWQVRYDGPGDRDLPQAIAVDPAGNVYVSGLAGTVRYDPQGNELWTVGAVAEYLVVDASGNAHGFFSRGLLWKLDGAGGVLWQVEPGLVTGRWNVPLVLDPLANVYVTGQSSDGRSLSVKYDASGRQLWAASDLDAQSADMYESPAAIAVDDQLNVYVTGSAFSESEELDWDIVTVSYDPQGEERWARRYDGPRHFRDYARGLALDAGGFLYVRGDADAEPVLLKYTLEGGLVWASHAISGVLALDPDGNLCVTAQDFTAKYDPDGRELWRVAGGGVSLAVDSSADVIVSGPLGTLKFDAGGSRLWQAEGSLEGPGLALDGAGNVLLAYHAYAANRATGLDYSTTKLSPDGEVLWKATHDSPGGGGQDGAVALALDREGNVVVTGPSEGFVPLSCLSPYYACFSPHYATVKYDPDGNELWLARYAGQRHEGFTRESDVPRALAVDAGGNVYVTGASIPLDPSVGGYLNTDYVTVKYDPNGQAFWVASHEQVPLGIDDPSALAVDAEGNVYVTGWSSRGACSRGGCAYSYATVKYAPGGERLWSAVYTGQANLKGGGDFATAVAVDSSGNVLVTGQSYADDNMAIATVKYDAAGNELWVARFNGGVIRWEPPPSPVVLAVDGANNVYVAGSATLLKYDPAGSLLWARGHEADSVTAVALDSSGNVYLAGNMLAVKYDPAGKELWSASLPVEALAVDEAGAAYLAGAEEGNYRVWIVDSDGDVVWDNIGPLGIARDIGLDGSGNVYVTGESEGDFLTIKYSPVRGQFPGDCSQDGGVDISDALCLLGFLFLGSPTVLPCGDGTGDDSANRELVDWNGDAGTDVSDAVALLGWLFLGSAPHVMGSGCRSMIGCPHACSSP